MAVGRVHHGGYVYEASLVRRLNVKEIELKSLTHLTTNSSAQYESRARSVTVNCSGQGIFEKFQYHR